MSRLPLLWGNYPRDLAAGWIGGLMMTVSTNSAIDTRLLRVLVAMVKNILAETPGDTPADTPVSDAEATTRSSCGPT